MRLYTVHMRRHALDAERDMAVIKEGFAWPAFVFSFLWALWHGLWAEAAILFAAEAAVGALMAALQLDAVSQAAVSLGAALIVGTLGNDLRRAALERRGFREAAVVAAGDGDLALKRFLDGEPALAAELRA